MAIFIIALCAILFAVYIFCYRWFSVDARIPILVLHAVVVVAIIGLAVLVWITSSGDYGDAAHYAAICGLAVFGGLLVKYISTELIANRTA